MAANFLGKLFGGEKKAELDSCCGAVSVTEEVETTEPANEVQPVKAESSEPAVVCFEQRT
ncbi:hypothetical protein [Streptosporangium sp. H16]|uniref:hypothetical protein n=1 Tax=Streptosporangium sp. H16 TaxID=3444184 RepID=UPI003F790AAA